MQFRMDRRFVSTAVGRYDSLNRRFRREVKLLVTTAI
jgi:hypothetical protein